MDLAIEANLLNDYEIEILYYELDDIKRSVEIKTKNTTYYKTEKEYYNYLYNKYVNRPVSMKKFSYEMLNLKMFFNNLKSKEVLAKKLLDTDLLHKKTLVYAGTIEQAESFKKPTYHSKLSKEIRKKNYEDFYNDKFLHLINVEGLRESVSIPNLTNLLLLAPGASDTALEQKLGRGCRLALNQKATFTILCTKNTIEENWLKKAIINLKLEKIKENNIW